MTATAILMLIISGGIIIGGCIASLVASLVKSQIDEYPKE